jgi:Flp pilus assembly protein TadD
MIAIRFLALLLLLLGSVGPGLWLVRRFPWSPAERLCGAIAASGVVLYLTSALIYVLDLPRFAYAVVSLACLGIGAAGAARGRFFPAGREVRRELGGFTFLVVWTLLLLALVRSYSGAMWSGDWIEHYRRTRFFLEHQPLGTLFGEAYSLPARPPFMNLLGAHFLGQVGERYDLFQVVFAILNLLPFFPCWLIVRLMAPRAAGRRGLIVLLCLLAASPLFMQNSTYAWTKGLANFYVITGLWFYLRGLRTSDPLRLASACLALAAGILVHYSAAPYAILLAAHFLFFVLPRRAPGSIGKSLAAALPGAALLGTWLAWSIAVYGAGATFGSNTTARVAGTMSFAENARKAGLNLFYSLVPHPLRLGYGLFRSFFYQPDRWGLFRDYFFTILQTNLVFGMGLVGGLVVLYQLWRLAVRPPGAAVGGRGFWFGLVILGAVFTVATHPTVDVLGVAHVCSQPLILLGLAFLAAGFEALPGALRVAVLFGCVADFFAGILVHFTLQGTGATIEGGVPGGTLRLTTTLLNRWAVLNGVAKEKLGYVFWGDHFAGLLPVLPWLVIALFSAVLAGLIGVIVDRRPSGGATDSALWYALAVPVALGAFGIAAMRPDGRDILPNPPGLDGCLEAVRSNPDSGEARYNLGLAVYRGGRVGESIDQWTEAVMLEPDHARARYFAQIVSGSYALPISAEFETAEAVFEYPGLAGARVALATRLWNRKHSAAAIAQLEEAVRLKPDYGQAYIYLGWMNLDLGRLPESISALETALRLDAGNPNVHYLIALPLYKLGRIAEAAGQLREALRLKPDFPEAQAALGRLSAVR